jgi:predicted negative regulator of RcsB-dependent stress response
MNIVGSIVDLGVKENMTKTMVFVIVLILLAAIGWKYRGQIMSKINSATGV